MKRKSLPQSFFGRDTFLVARELLGKMLVREYRGKRIEGIITEVEAYDGSHDLASHASRGRTPRNEVMFGPPGHWYVYLVYGMHWMLNVVTREEGYPAATLIRGVQAIEGPGRVTKHFRVGKSLNAKRVVSQSTLWVEDSGIMVPKSAIQSGPRIGVEYAGRTWVGKPWRFFLDKIPCVGMVSFMMTDGGHILNVAAGVLPILFVGVIALVFILLTGKVTERPLRYRKVTV